MGKSLCGWAFQMWLFYILKNKHAFHKTEKTQNDFQLDFEMNPLQHFSPLMAHLLQYNKTWKEMGIITFVGFITSANNNKIETV